MNRRVTLLAAAAAALAGTPLAAAPQLAQLAPLALMPGETVTLTLQGQQLAGARQLWTSFASRCEFQPAESESAQKGESLSCRVTVPRGEQVGVGALRLATGDGVSNPVLIMLDDLPTAAESPENHSLAQAQAIDWPKAVDGQCDALAEDWYRIHAAAGERLSFEIVAQRLGSNLDPQLRLLTADGAELARVDDAEGAGGDCRFSHTFEAEGDYLLTVGDVRHAGGGDAFRYRLRVGKFPLFRTVYPAGGKSGGVASFELADPAGEPAAPTTLHVALPAAEDEARLVYYGVPSRENAGSGWFPVEANPQGETLEHEPNDQPAEATPAALPGALNGRLNQAGDRDCFKFQGRKGQRIYCTAKTRELGSSCDLYMTLNKADGSQIAVARQERETVLAAEIAEDGEYVLQVENLLSGDETSDVYRVDVSDVYAGFALHAEQTQYSSPQGGTFVMKVLAQRRDYNGPIELAVEGLGEGVKLEGHVFDGAETLLKITLPADVAQGEIRHARIVGKAKVGETTVAVPATMRVPLATMFPNVPSLPSQLLAAVAVGVGPAFPPFFDLSPPGPDVYFPQLVGESSFEVAVNRTNEGFKEPVAIAVEGLPEGIAAETAPVDDGLKAVRVVLKGKPDLAEGKFPIRIVGTGKFQEQTRVVTLEQLSLNVRKPLVVSVAVAGPIAAGGQQQAVVKVQRFGSEPQPVRVRIGEGPQGLLAPLAVEIPADASEATVALGAAADAPPGKFETLVAVASTSVKGQDITVQSNPASVEIQPPTVESPTEALP